ncbi:Uncharacterised protein [Vibrio cholerae]|nr:Uncharacterised protein [Vibrio cholerae]CSD21064.1 Uncharacterised protein [Vibrio cholerae]
MEMICPSTMIGERFQRYTRPSTSVVTSLGLLPCAALVMVGNSWRSRISNKKWFCASSRKNWICAEGFMRISRPEVFQSMVGESAKLNRSSNCFSLLARRRNDCSNVRPK